MKKIATFIAGIVVGILGCYFVMRTKTTSVDQMSVMQSPPERKLERHGSTEATRPVKIVEREPNQEQSAIPPEAVKEHQQREDAPPKRQFEIILSEADVSELEAQWNDLPQQAAATLEERGWRIKMLLPGSILSTAGLHEGDLVTKNWIQTLSRAEGNDGLAVRVTNILNQITR